MYAVYVFLIKDAGNLAEVKETLYAYEGADYGQFTRSTAWKSVVGSGRSVVGLNFLFKNVKFAKLMRNNLPTRSVEEEIFTYSMISKSSFLLLSVGAGALVLLIVARIVNLFKNLRLIYTRKYLLFVIAAAWIIVYGTFLTWWEPHNTEFWSTILIPSWILVWTAFVFTPPKRAASKLTIILLVVLLFTVNLFGGILLQKSRKGDFWYQRNKWLINNAKSDDLIVAPFNSLSKAYIKYSLPDVNMIDLICQQNFEDFTNNFELAQKNTRGRTYFVGLEGFPRPMIKYLRREHQKIKKMYDYVLPQLTIIHSHPLGDVYEYKAP